MQYLIVGIVLLAMIIGVLGKTYSAGKDSAMLEWQASIDRRRAAEEKQVKTATLALQGDNTKRRTFYKKVTEYVDREVVKVEYRTVCLPPVGLCLANRSLLRESADRCNADGRVSYVDTSAGRSSSNGVAEVR